MIASRSSVSCQASKARVLTLGRAGAGDVAEGLSNWRLWHLIGTAELRRRYARSYIGEFWLSLSTAIVVVALGLVWSLLWRMPLAEMLPYFALGYVIWLFVSAFFMEATTVFVASGSYYMNQRMPFSTGVFALTYRNLITLGHNSLIVVVVVVIYSAPLAVGAFAAIPGLILATVIGFSAAYVVAILCTRYRDITHVVASAMQVLFFVTPILWKEEQLPTDRRWIVDFNPFAVLVSVVRDPILGIPVSWERWVVALSITAVTLMLALIVVGRYRQRIIFWL